MKKMFCPLFVLFPLLLSGCARSYSVYVDGFAETAAPIPPNARVQIVTDPNSENPLFDKEIKAKIAKLLASRGFVPVDDPQSDCRLTFNFGIRYRLVTDVEFISSHGTMRRHNIIGGPGYYAPYARNVWDETLHIKVFKGNAVVWVGEAATSRYYSDKRQAINYLLVATFEFFGQNTGRQKVITIEEKDPRIASLGS
jgi:hypothetical protein